MAIFNSYVKLPEGKYHGSPYVWVGLIMSKYVRIIQHSRSSQRSGKWSKGTPGSIWWVLVTFPSNKLWNLGLSNLISPFAGFWFVIIHRSKIKKHIMFSRFQPNLLPGVIFNPKTGTWVFSFLIHLRYSLKMFQICPDIDPVSI